MTLIMSELTTNVSDLACNLSLSACLAVGTVVTSIYI